MGADRLNRLVERILAPLRSEEAAFQMLLRVAAVGALVIGLVLLARAVF